MGAFCENCSKKEKKEEESSILENDYIESKIACKNLPESEITRENHLEIKNNIFGVNRNSINEQKKMKFEPEQNNHHEKNISSKSSGNIRASLKININKNMKKFVQDDKLIIEEDDDDELNAKKNKREPIPSHMMKISCNIEKPMDSNDIELNQKKKIDAPIRRRKKKSATVKQNQFLFFQIFSAEICVPISQENLIWGKKGIPKNNYKRGQLLGKGAYGNVYESRSPIFNNKVAMKIINKNKVDYDENNIDNDYIKSEINILRKLSHPNIVRIYEFYESDNCFYLINEFCQFGELSNYLKINTLSETQICVIFYQVLSGLIYLHENHILHGDLKPENILISSIEKNLETNEDYAWIKIIDFGTAKIFKKKINKGDDIVGTLYFISPEMFSFDYDKYDEKCDIWSLGVIFYLTITKKYPFRGRNEDETIKLIMDNSYNYDENALDCSDELKDLIKQLLMKNPNQRPSAKEALNHKWFKKYNGRRLFTNFKKEEMKPFIDNLLNFSFSKLHQLVFAFLVHNLTETESIQKILKLYRYFNESGNCKLSKEELKKGLLEFKSQEEIEEKIDNLFKELDADNNGTVEFEEFLRACIDKKEIINDKYLSYAFNFLDKNDRKFLSLEEIISAFVNEDNKKLKDDMINILVSKGYDKNGLIGFEDFKTLINSLDKKE